MEEQTPSQQYTGRILWMTDTFDDHNGVSTVLSALLDEIRLSDLPIDLLICNNSRKSEDHLIVVRQFTEFTIPIYKQQVFRIPNYLSVQRAFRQGKYSKIICSTEGPMGLAAMWLKKVFSVETYFFLHTDWITFAKETLQLEEKSLYRLQKMLKAYYKQFGNVFVLNTDQQRWLTGDVMQFDPSKIYLTAHWADRIFSYPFSLMEGSFPFDSRLPTVLYTGRISKEKGVMELPGIMRLIRSVIPEVRLIVAGTGPAEEALRMEMPDACFLGWVDRETLPVLFRSCDLLLLPSRFDTFSCVVLEALACGLPVIAYNSKGPKDIIRDAVNGYLVGNKEEMAGKAIDYFLSPDQQKEMKKAALQRAEDYQPGKILDQLLKDTGILSYR